MPLDSGLQVPILNSRGDLEASGKRRFEVEKAV